MGRKRYSFAAAFGLAGMGFASGMGEAQAEGLDTYLWSERPLIVFAPREAHPDVDRQMTLLADHAGGLSDRHMAILIVGPSRIFATFGRPAPAAEPAQLRRRFRVPDGEFRAILIGKDGGVKLTAREPVTAERLFTLIDGMPMRQREMRDAGSSSEN